MRFHGVNLMVDDVQKTVDFYDDAFGMKPGFADPDGTFTVLTFPGETPGPGSVVLAVEHWSKIEDFASPTPPSAVRIGLEFEDVDAAYKKALAAGATSAKAPIVRPWGQKIAVVKDNSGFLIELCAPVEYK
ncbi:VOC family protein [Nocardia sp. XZ_19_369]|uniref:VOC family protein n=1 Tax=Nocardia sp. XZ_19_369 TaxID=2769487 RepID=UPI00188E4635|nr:VOC family protein [Nocardia sp. XZ_19_369]